VTLHRAAIAARFHACAAGQAPARQAASRSGIASQSGLLANGSARCSHVVPAISNHLFCISVIFRRIGTIKAA